MAKKDEIIGAIRGMLPEGAVIADEAYGSGSAYAVHVPLGKLREVAAVFRGQEFYLESLAGLDFSDTIELVYHFNCFEPKSRIAVRVLCGHDQIPPTLSDVFKSADWLEREVCEFYGLQFEGHKDLRPLLLPEDADYHPLRKTFGNVHAYHRRDEIYG